MNFSLIYRIAERFIGVHEGVGTIDNPMVLSMLRLDNATSHLTDETPWCSAFVNYIAWLLRLPRSKSLAARSWLTVGTPVHLSEAQQGDVVVLNRAGGPADPTVLNAPGHVGLFSSQVGSTVYLLGGNQSDAVSVVGFDATRVLGVRRLV